ncbi:hypothetical protein ACLKA6_013731 [Drosophila palustris]
MSPDSSGLSMCGIIGQVDFPQLRCRRPRRRRLRILLLAAAAAPATNGTTTTCCHGQWSPISRNALA